MTNYFIYSSIRSVIHQEDSLRQWFLNLTKHPASGNDLAVSGPLLSPEPSHLQKDGASKNIFKVPKPVKGWVLSKNHLINGGGCVKAQSPGESYCWLRVQEWTFRTACKVTRRPHYSVW